MTMRLSIISFAGMVRTLVAVGIGERWRPCSPRGSSPCRAAATTSSFAVAGRAAARGASAGMAPRLRRRRTCGRRCAAPRSARTPARRHPGRATVVTAVGEARGLQRAARPQRRSALRRRRAAHRGRSAPTPGSSGASAVGAARRPWTGAPPCRRCGASLVVAVDGVVRLEHRPPGPVDRVLDPTRNRSYSSSTSHSLAPNSLRGAFLGPGNVARHGADSPTFVCHIVNPLIRG